MADIEQKAQEGKNDQPPDQFPYHRTDAVPATVTLPASSKFPRTVIPAGMTDSAQLSTVAVHSR